MGIASSREALIWVQVSSSSDPVIALPFFGFGALRELVIPRKKALVSSTKIILFFPVSWPNKKEDLPISSFFFGTDSGSFDVSDQGLLSVENSL